MVRYLTCYARGLTVDPYSVRSTATYATKHEENETTLACRYDRRGWLTGNLVIQFL